MLKRKFNSIALLVLIPGFIQAQSCYQVRLASSVKSYESGNYNDAVTQLKVAKNCSDADKKVLDEWLKKCAAGIEGQRRSAEAGVILKGKNKAMVDSVKKIIALNYKHGWEKGAEPSELRYIKACTFLADYYRKAKNFTPAIFYYRKVTDMTTGSDSDLGENSRAIKEWEKTRKKLAELFKEKPDLAKNMDSVLILVEDNQQITNIQLSEFSNYFFGDDDFILSKLISKDSVFQEYLINPLYVNRQPQYGKADRMEDLFLQLGLPKIAQFLRNNPLRTLSLTISPHKSHYQTVWQAGSIQEIIKDYLVEIQGISPDKIWLSEDHSAGWGKHNGIKVWRIEIVITEN